MTKLATERLIMDELGMEDAQFLLQSLNDEAFIKHIGDRGVRTLPEAEQYLINRVVPSYAENGFGMYAVRLKATGEALGMCGLVNRPGLDDIDLGYSFLPGARGRGYALEAAREILNWATGDLGIKRLVAIVSPDNRASIVLLEKLGMQFETMIQLPEDEQKICLYAWGEPRSAAGA